MPKKSAKPDYEVGKRTLKRKTGRLRERERQKRIGANLGILKSTINCPSLVTGQAIGVAAEMLANRQPGGTDHLFHSLTHYFFEDLHYQFGIFLPVSSYWRKFIEIVEKIDDKVAQALLADGYEKSFRWLAYGHVQRLGWIYDQREDSVLSVELYEDTSGKITPVGVRRNGKRFLMAHEEYPPHPLVCFPGDHFKPLLDKSGFIKLASARNKQEADDAIRSAKRGNWSLVGETLLINVALLDSNEEVAKKMKLPLAMSSYQKNRK